MTKPSKECFKVDYPADFDEITIEGARLPFKIRVRKAKTTKAQSSSGEMKSFQRNGDNFEKISNTLTDWAKKNTGNKRFVRISDTLVVDFGLPVSIHPPSSVITQVLFVGENSPMFVLTLCESKTTISSEMKDITESPSETDQNRQNEVETFTALVTKKMMSSLLRFCYYDFIILQCTLTYDTFCTNPDELTNEIRLKMQQVRQFYGGPGYLDSRSYDAITFAVDACKGITYLPGILSDPRTTTPVLMDPDWLNMTLHYIKTLCKEKTVVLAEKETFKTKVALLEAARRLSFREDVHVATGKQELEQELEQCFKAIVIKTEEETGTRINLKNCFIENMQKPELIVVVVGGTAKCPACHAQSPELSLEPDPGCHGKLRSEAVTEEACSKLRTPYVKSNGAWKCLENSSLFSQVEVITDSLH